METYFFEDECEVYPKSELQIFNDEFLKRFNLFRCRIKRLKELEENSLDYETYFDMVLIQLRALCFESINDNKNYTVQNYLKKNGFEDKVEEVKSFFSRSIGFRNTTLRELIKHKTDKFIAHNDTIMQEVQTNNELSEDKELDVKNVFLKFLAEQNLKTTNEALGMLTILRFLESMVNLVE